jgi:hypothetical protein
VCDAGERGRKDKQAGADIEYLHDFLITVIIFERPVSEGLANNVLNNTAKLLNESSVSSASAMSC